MSLSDCRRRGIRRLWLPCVPCPVPTAETRLRSGSPGYLACSVIARSPQPPRASRRMLAFVASPTMAGFTILGGDSRRQQRNEAESGSLALGLATSLSGGYHPPLSATLADRHVSRALSPPHAEAQLHVERTINMCSTFQLHRTRRHSRLNPKTLIDLIFQGFPCSTDCNFHFLLPFSVAGTIFFNPLFLAGLCGFAARCHG